MGIIRKQGFSNSIIYYIGIAVGYVNAVLLYPAFFSTEQIGLINILISLSVLYAQFSSIGVPSIISRFFPFFKTNDKTHHGFIVRTSLLAATGFILFTLLFFLLKPYIFIHYIDKYPLLTKYFYYIIPLAFFTLFFNVLESFARTIYRNVTSAFLREVFLRISTCAAILLYSAAIIDFEQFVLFYLGINVLIAVILLIQLLMTREFILSFRFSSAGIPDKELLRYGLYTLLTGAAFVLMQKIDLIMLSWYMGLSIAGIYATFFNIATVIVVPARAMSRTTYQIIAESWKDDNRPHILHIYKTTSTAQLAVGCLLYIGLILNQHNLLSFIKNPEFLQHFDTFIVIGLAFLIDITGGLNAHIIMSSHKYRVIAITMLFCLAVCILLNYLLIPTYGELGAAWAFMLTMFLYNLINSTYILIRFKMQPFDWKHLGVIVIASVAFLIGNAIPIIKNQFLDILVRSGVTTLIYSGFLLGFRISPPLNNALIHGLQKINKALKR